MVAFGLSAPKRFSRLRTVAVCASRRGAVAAVGLSPPNWHERTSYYASCATPIMDYAPHTITSAADSRYPSNSTPRSASTARLQYSDCPCSSDTRHDYADGARFIFSQLSRCASPMLSGQVVHEQSLAYALHTNHTCLLESNISRKALRNVREVRVGTASTQARCRGTP